MKFEDRSLVIITVNEYQYRTLAKCAANQPIDLIFQSPTEPIRRSGTDQIMSAMPNPYVVARSIRSVALLCEEIEGSRTKARIQNNT